MTTDSAGLRSATDEYVASIDGATGLYLDCTSGFTKNLKQLEEGQHRALAILGKSDPSHATREYVDSLQYFYGTGDPNDPSNVLLYWSTQGEFRARHGKRGANYRLIGQFCLVLIFEYWEGEYRQRITNALGLARKEDLTEPIMGDLRLIRNDIIHHQGVVTSETARKLEVIQGLLEGHDVFFNDEAFHSIIREVKSFLDRLVSDATGDDPEYRKIWHVE